MTAVYPLAIKTFTTKRNLLDDVDASDVNDLQNEIIAIEQALGVNPQTDGNLPYNKTKRWKSVADRLHDIQTNNDVPVCLGGRWGKPYQRIRTERDNQFLNIASASHDTHGMYNGSNGFKVVRPGYYMCECEVGWVPSSLRGRRTMGFDINGGKEGGYWSPVTFWGDGEHANSSDMSLNTAALIPLQRNQVVRVKAHVDETYRASQWMDIQWVHLSMFWVRDF